MTSDANRRTRSALIALLASMALVFTVASPAFSQSTLNGYGDQGDKAQGQVQGTIQGSDSPEAPDQSSSNPAPESGDDVTVSAKSGSDSLPFTGFEVGIMLAIGASLVIVGFGLHRVSRPPAS